MSLEPLDPQTAALTTLSLLETRLQRLEFLLTGLSDYNGRPKALPAPSPVVSQKDTIIGRLNQLQADLTKLRKLPGPAGELVRDVESLRSQIPEIFTDSAPKHPTSLSDQTTHIFANTSLYTETASRLSSLQTLPVPLAEQSSQLLELRPRIDVARSKQDELEAHARELRERSARCLEWWVRIGVVGMGEVWTDWEERVKEAERRVGRVERARREREGYV